MDEKTIIMSIIMILIIIIGIIYIYKKENSKMAMFYGIYSIIIFTLWLFAVTTIVQTK